MTVYAICDTNHRPEGAGPGAVVATFPDWQAASARGIEESYPNCLIRITDEPPATRGSEQP